MTDTETSGEPPGFGDPCRSSAECSGYEDAYCMMNSLVDTWGVCTIENCEFDQCPDGYSCCDCSDSMLVPRNVVCLETSEAKLASDLEEWVCDIGKEEQIEPKGFGEPCMDSSECGLDGADHCMSEPIYETGYFTNYCSWVLDCPARYACCDCEDSSSFPPVQACLARKDAYFASNAGRCFCECLS